MNHITIELCAEDRARIDRLTAAIEKTLSPMKDVEAVAAGVVQEKAEEPVRQEEKPAEVESAPAKEEKPTITLDMLRALAQELIAPDADPVKKEKTRTIVKSYARSLSQIPNEKWPEVYAALTALKEE
ncbi:MAG: hypothetical protein IKY91_02090 [Akkermansia sp.]|nr:hypothetical protein [Akkermansia sp.]